MSKMWNNVARLKRHLKTTKQEQSGVSDHVIRVPGPEDHYSNPPTMSSIPFVRSHSILFAPLLSSLFILVPGLSLLFVEPHNNYCTYS